MTKITADYSVTVNDFRQATYYALALQHGLFLRLTAGAVVLGAVCVISSAAGTPVLPPAFLLPGVACLIWLFVLLGQAELGIRNYIVTKDCLIGRKTHFEMEENRIRIRIPDKKILANLTVSNLACAFEISALFLLYATGTQVYLVPRRAFSEEELASIRAQLKNQLSKRFSTRFDGK